MTSINRQTQRIATWLSRATPRNELKALSDRTLHDIGLIRYQPAFEASGGLGTKTGLPLSNRAHYCCVVIAAGAQMPFCRGER